MEPKGGIRRQQSCGAVMEGAGWCKEALDPEGGLWDLSVESWKLLYASVCA